jgi:23S rRNA (guanosine2251-2'-O)-methyltransferase
VKRLLAGRRAVEEALAADPQHIVVVYVQDDAERFREIDALARRAGVRCEPRTSGELDALARGVKHQGVLAITGEYAYAELDAVLSQAGPAPLIVALDQITDPHNFGAIVRSCVAFGAAGIITLKDRAAPVTAVVVRASAGATERARIVRVTNLARTLEGLRDRGLRVVGLDAAAPSTLDTLQFGAEGRVLVIGSEGNGLRRLTRELCDELARIEMPGQFESLNASVAASIALYESARGRAQLELTASA